MTKQREQNTQPIDYDNFIMIPNNFILDYNPIVLDIVSTILKYQSIDNLYVSHLDTLLYSSKLINNTNGSNKRIVKDYVNSLDGFITDSKIIYLDTNSLYIFNDDNIKSNFTKISSHIYTSISDVKIFAYYCYLILHINRFNGIFSQSLQQIHDSIGLAQKTIIKYNKYLTDNNLMFIASTGDILIKSTNQVISSSNYYSLDESYIKLAIDSHQNTKSNFNWSDYKSNKLDSNTKRKATGIINYYSKLSWDTLNNLQQDKLLWAYNIKLQQDKLEFITYGKDDSKIKDAKIYSLIDRYSKSNFIIDYDIATDLFNGVITVSDLIKKE